MFPVTRMRRMRSDERIRSMFRETSVDISDFIYPLYIKESTENITELKNQTLPKNTEKKQEIIKDIKDNNKLKDLIAKIKNKVKKISKQNNK